jgi:hypothetical protein
MCCAAQATHPVNVDESLFGTASRTSCRHAAPPSCCESLLYLSSKLLLLLLLLLLLSCKLPMPLLLQVYVCWYCCMVKATSFQVAACTGRQQEGTRDKSAGRQASCILQWQT